MICEQGCEHPDDSIPTRIALDHAVTAYRDNPTVANRNALFAAMTDHTNAIYHDQIIDWMARTR